MERENKMTSRKCSTCKHFKIIDTKSIWQWGTCTKPGQTMTEEGAAACGCPCWEAKE